MNKVQNESVSKKEKKEQKRQNKTNKFKRISNYCMISLIYKQISGIQAIYINKFLQTLKSYELEYVYFFWAYINICIILSCMEMNYAKSKVKHYFWGVNIYFIYVNTFSTQFKFLATFWVYLETCVYYCLLFFRSPCRFVLTPRHKSLYPHFAHTVIVIQHIP